MPNPHQFRRLLQLGSCVLLLSAPAIQARDWHVSGAGDDANDGASPATAFRTLQKAAGLVEPGDVVLIGDGVYTNGDTFKDSALVSISRSGRPDAWIIWKAAPGAHPDLRPKGWNGIYITGSYHVVEGLTVTGLNDSLFLQQAVEDAKITEKDGKKYPGDPRFNTNGIIITGRPSGPDAKPHHHVIRGCTISKCGGGIVVLDADYAVIEDNVIFDNSWFTRYATSGISTYENWAFDDAPGYHNVIQRNRVWNNRTLVPWYRTGKLSDGNGIILDSSRADPDNATNPNADAVVTNPNADPAVTPSPGASPAAAPKPPAAVAAPKPPRPEWRGRTLVANNLSAFNGGSGIHAFQHRHADIINNTTYWNTSSTGYGELFANRSDDINVLNNVIIPRPTGRVTTNNKNTNVRWDYNLYPVRQEATAQQPQDVLTGPHDLVADPMFVKIARDLREADFRLQAGSPARDSGTDDVPQATDVLGQPRPAGIARDRGAFEQ